MSEFLVNLYSIIPKWLRLHLGKSRLLSKFRNALLRTNHTFKATSVYIKRDYQDYQLGFKFNASIQVASKAKRYGVENKLLLHSLTLLKSHSHPLTVVDIGANFGYLSLVWAQTLCKDGGHVYSFEPNVNVFKTFKNSISDNQLDEIITLEHLAVGSKNEPIELLVNNTTSNVISTAVAEQRYLIDMVTVDHYFDTHCLNNCNLIKIDVDGIELAILKGSLATLKKFKPIFIVETNNDLQIIDFFKANNYKIMDMDLNVFDYARPIPLNIFCVPNEVI